MTDERLKNVMDSYLKKYSDLTKRHLGKCYDYETVEDKVRDAINKGAKLNLVVGTLTGLPNWGAKEHWGWVPLSDESGPPEPFKAVLRRYGDDRRGLVKDLRKYLKDVRTVSVLLRFTDPKRFAIWSNPIEKLLGVKHGRSNADTYVNYLDDLGLIGKAGGLDRLADVDMALWGLEKEDRKEDVDAFERSDVVLEIRAKNLLTYLTKLDGTRLVRALAKVHQTVASLAGFHQFERHLLALEKLGWRKSLTQPDEEVTLGVLIGFRKDWHRVDPIRHANWRRLNHARNNLVHRNKPLESRELPDLIKELSDLEKDLRLPVR